MFNILVVDDEKIEREGVRFLIQKKELPLQVTEAENGEKALELLKIHKMDILFTDIKMPFMDGLQLAEQASSIQPQLKIIILSAYGEFEYAKRAIHLDVFHYLLKPIDVAEFTDVMLRVIRLCEEERGRGEREDRLLEGYRKGLLYKKERLLLDLLHGGHTAENFQAKAGEMGWDWDAPARMRLLLLDMDHRFFDAVDDDFQNRLEQLLPWTFDYVNLNEHQSVLFLHIGGELRSKEELEGLGRKIQQQLKSRDGVNAVLVFSGILGESGGIPLEYRKMEKELENKFFFREPAVLFTEIEEAPNAPVPDLLNQTLEDIPQLINRHEKDLARQRIEKLFREMEDSGRLSSIYVKYVCTEIVKAILQSGEQRPAGDFQQIAEQIYKTQNLHEVKDILIGMIDKETPNGLDSQRKVIHEVLHIIHRDYRNDIGLESLAEKVYLSPSYLSRLFKTETGTSIVKYITAYRLKRASELLRRTNKKIIDISTEVGYTNFSYFCAIFRNYYGATPTQYRDEE